DRVLPPDVDLDELVQVPVAPDVDQLGAIRPESRVCEAGGEHHRVEAEVTVPGRRLERTDPETPRTQVERAQRLDKRAVADRLAGDEIPGLHEPAVDRTPDLRPVGSLRIALVPALPGRQERQPAAVVSRVQLPQRPVAPLDYPRVERQERQRGGVAGRG